MSGSLLDIGATSEVVTGKFRRVPHLSIKIAATGTRLKGTDSSWQLTCFDIAHRATATDSIFHTATSDIIDIPRATCQSLDLEEVGN